MIRKTVLTTAIVGAGLASTTGAAFAGDAPSESGHHHSSKSSSSSGCSNESAGKINNAKSGSLIGVLDGSQGALGVNVCDILSGNSIGSGNEISIL